MPDFDSGDHTDHTETQVSCREGEKKKLLNSNNYLHVKSAAKQHLGRSLQ